MLRRLLPMARAGLDSWGVPGEESDRYFELSSQMLLNANEAVTISFAAFSFTDPAKFMKEVVGTDGLFTTDEITDPQNLDMWLDVNGQAKQRGNTKTMIFGVAQLVSYVSRFMTLYPGDLISTGTPPGVGMGVKPNPVYLKAGDTMRLGIEKLGEQQQTVHAWNPALIDG